MATGQLLEGDGPLAGHRPTVLWDSCILQSLFPFLGGITRTHTHEPNR